MKTILLTILSCLLFTSSQATPPGRLKIVLHHRVGKETLVLGSPLVNVLGDTITVKKFKYYLSNFSVVDEKGITTVLPAQYFLIDEADIASKSFLLDIGEKKIAGIRFMLGVDSIKNVSGIQDGVLDPLRGMFWTWNTGYISAKLEGVSPSSQIAMQSFTYHIGGYRSPYASMRWIELAVPRGNSDSLVINADINHWFHSKTPLRISDTPVCHSTGELAARIADNYSTMFSVESPQ